MKRSWRKELMDLGGNPREVLDEDLRNLRIINRWLGGYRGVLRALDRLTAGRNLQRFSLLDVGTGSGDIPVQIARWARRRGLRAEVLGLEAEPMTVAVAAQHTRPCSEITVIRGDAVAPPFRDRSLDFVLASQLLHHFSEDEIVGSLRTWSRLARRAIIVSDLIRHPVAYAGIRLATLLCTRNPMTRTDAPLSVQRGFTVPEWGALFARAAVGPFEVIPVFPYRVLALVSLPDRT